MQSSTTASLSALTAVATSSSNGSWRTPANCAEPKGTAKCTIFANSQTSKSKGEQRNPHGSAVWPQGNGKRSSYAETVTTPSMPGGQHDSWFRRRSLESLVRRKRSCGVRRGADRKVPARADNSLAAYSTLWSRSHRSSRGWGEPITGRRVAGRPQMNGGRVRDAHEPEPKYLSSTGELIDIERVTISSEGAVIRSPETWSDPRGWEPKVP